jgi:hypothetical protein
LAKKPIFLHNIKVQIPTKMENQFEVFLKKMALASGDYKDKSYVDNVEIKERRLLVSVNNTWRDLGSLGDQQYYSLSQPNSHGMSVFSGNLVI